jgi:energy-coupling factor transporter ATP-binding protein EcfA2
MTDSKFFELAIQPSLIEYFAIEGLYGYRTVSLDSKYAATILIAKNGASKTTLLAALDAVLKRQFSRLAELKFERILLKLRSSDELFVIAASDVSNYMAFDEFFESEARRVKLSPFEFCRYIESFSLPITEWGQGPIAPIGAFFGYDQKGISSFIERCRGLLLSRTPFLKRALGRLVAALQDIEVVYLPTYRRLELSMPLDAKEPRGRSKAFPQNRNGLHSGEIGFGLGDIPERLYELNQAILIDSNQGYRAISAKIIQDLLDGTFDRMEIEETDQPSKEDMKLLFSRLKEGVRRHSVFDVGANPFDLEKLFSDRSRSSVSNKFLSFFLAQLSVVISATKEKERLVQTFVDRCNAYLSSADESVNLGWDKSYGLDAKELKLSRTDLSVSVRSKIRKKGKGDDIPLDALSSGEKQLISLLGKIYLYPKEKIVLIDEPELSLSMDWQRKILLDILDAPLCKQMIAITHSPFVFENALEPFAQALTTRIDPEAVDLFDDEDVADE